MVAVVDSECRVKKGPVVGRVGWKPGAKGVCCGSVDLCNGAKGYNICPTIIVVYHVDSI